MLNLGQKIDSGVDESNNLNFYLMLCLEMK